jgi:tyrosine-protein kinase Etk/Wzc
MEFNGNTVKDKSSKQNSMSDYIYLIRNNLVPVLLILLAAVISALIYAINSRNIYESTTSLKISKPQGSILSSVMAPEVGDFTDDRFISTEIEIMNSLSVRLNTAEALIDSFKVVQNPDSFYVIFDHHNSSKNSKEKLLSVSQIANILKEIVNIEQKRDIDIVDISVQSPSPYEAALIANIYAEQYKLFNLDANRDQLTVVREFLAGQAKNKLTDLNNAEDNLSKFQAEKGIIALDDQSKALITQLANFEAQRDDVVIDLAGTQKALAELKEEMSQQNPKIASYLESLAQQSYFTALQEGIAKLQVNKDIALSDNSQIDKSSVVKDYDNQINSLKAKLNDKIDIVKNGLFASNPDAIKYLTENIVEAQIKEKSLSIEAGELNNLVSKYSAQFNKLPVTAIEYSRLEKDKEASQTLYSLLEEKYQEALINEQSQPGNVFIVDKGVRSFVPAKPNRIMIVLIGIFLGSSLAFGYVFVKNYFDNTIKTPEDIQKKNINVLAWIPQIEGIGDKEKHEFEFIVAKKPNSIPSEAFRALRTRIQYSRIGNDALKTILITSAAPQEGKTTISVNIAGTFAQSNKKTLLVDLDLRKPRLHNLFKLQRYPGLIDYLFGLVPLEEIIRPTGVNNLSFISSGTIPPNPSEMIESKAMQDLISKIRKMFDVVVFDSAPIIAVTDSEILASLVDATILVVSAEKTEFDLMEKAAELIKKGSTSFIGSVLNNFVYKSGYGSYYKYYYYYSHPTNGRKTKSVKKNIETKYI